jgi:hypothetical protein
MVANSSRVHMKKIILFGLFLVVPAFASATVDSNLKYGKS